MFIAFLFKPRPNIQPNIRLGDEETFLYDRDDVRVKPYQILNEKFIETVWSIKYGSNDFSVEK